MIQKMRWKFIVISMLSLISVLILTLGGLIGIVYVQGRQEVNEILSIIAKSDGVIRSSEVKKQFGTKYVPESTYQYRYFSVIVDERGIAKIVDNSQIKTVSPDQIKDSAKDVLIDEKKQAGAENFLKELISIQRQNGNIKYNGTRYAYEIIPLGHKKHLIIFLDESTIMNRAYMVMRAGVLLGCFVIILFAVILILVSRRAVRPIAKAFEKQKQFVTNAGHELKTPLAIISANTEMQEIMGDESEWTNSTKQQVERLSELIKRLLSLASMSEQSKIEVSKVNLSNLVDKSANSFKSIIQKDEKDLKLKIEPNLYIKSEESSIFELINILVDNANKYCDEHGLIIITLNKGKLGRNAVLEVKNSFVSGEKINYNKFFERFYREDESRNRDEKTSGYGIGLSMAKEIVERNKGKIESGYKNGFFTITVLLKLKK